MTLDDIPCSGCGARTGDHVGEGRLCPCNGKGCDACGDCRMCDCSHKYDCPTLRQHGFQLPHERTLNWFNSIQVWRAGQLPPGEEFGAQFIVNGELVFVTKRELERIQSAPTAEEIQAKLDEFYKAFPILDTRRKND